MMEERIRNLEERIGYHFRDPAYLKEALIHSSYANERKINKVQCNERMEFLGDAVLEMVSSDYLFRTYPEMPEGDLSKLRAALVCEEALAESAKMIGLGDCILLGKGESAGGGSQKASVTSDAFEALIGAIFLDGGMETVQAFILRFVLGDVEGHMDFRDSKSLLQEIVQGMDGSQGILYTVLEEKGPEHDKTFLVQVSVNGRPCGTGEGKNKKAAEKAAAKEAVKYFRNGETYVSEKH